MANEFVARNGIIALDNSAITGSLNVSGGITGSLFGTASFSNTASFVNPLRQDVIITGSLSVSGSILLNGTGSIIGSGSTNYLSKFTGTTALGNSQIFDNGTSVGINTTSPSSTLELYKSSGTNYLYITNAASTTNNGVVLRYLGVDYMGMIGNFFTGELKIGGFNASSFFPTFYSNNAERMRLTPSGRLLIGTSTESTFLLDVNGTSRFTNNMVVTGSITANGAAIVYSVQKNQADQSNPLQFYVAYNHINPRIEFWGGQGARLYYNTSTRVLSPDTASGVDLGTSALNFGNVFSNTITTNTSSFFATVSGSVGIGKTTANARLDVSGSAIVTGSLTVTQGITGSLLGTASLATTASNALTASFVQNAISASFASTASFVTTAQTASFVQNAVSASFAATASSADNFLVRGTLTAQTIVAQTITSSTDFVTGSTRFGSLSSNTHQFTGSVSITGSLTATGSVNIAGGVSASGNIYQGGTGNASTVLASNGNTALLTISSTGATINMGRLGAVSLLANSTDGGIIMNDGAYLGVSSGTLRIGSNLAANNVVIGNFANSTATINGNTTISGSTVISGSFTVFTGSAVEFQVTNTGVRIGNASTDTHTVTGSFNVSGSITATSNVLVTGSLLISTGSLSDFLRTSNAGVTNFRISSSGYPVWGVPGFDVVSVPGATWTPTVTWDGTNVQWGDNRANRSIMTPGIGGGYVTVPNITFINATYATQVNNLFGNSFIVNNNNVTSTLGTINMIIQATGSQTGNMLQFRNGAGSVLSGVDASGSLFINKTTANARLDVNGPTIISGSLTVFTGSAVELQVTNTGVRMGNIITDVHTVTGSFNVSGSVTLTGSIDITSVLNPHTITNTNSVSAGSTLRIVSANSTSSFTDRGLTISSAPGAFFESRVDTIRGRADYFAGLRVNGVGETGSAAIPLWLMGQHPIYGVGSSYRFALVAFDGTNYNDIFNVTPSTFNVQVGGRTDAGYKLDVQGTLRNTTDAYLNTTSGNTSIGKTTANAKLDVNGSTIISGSFTVFTGSAVEFQVTNTGVRMGNIATDTHTVTGSMYQSGSTVALSLRGSGSGVFTVDGTAGRLFSVDDSLSGSLFSVNTAAGLPVIEAFSDNTVRIGQYGQRVLFVSQSRVGIGKETGLNANLDVSGSAIISGSFTVVTGSAVEFQVTNTGVRIGNITADVHTVTGSFNISGSGFVHGGGFIVSGTLETSGSTSQGLVAPLKFTTVTGSYTLVRTDEGKMVELSSSLDQTFIITIPTNTSVPYPLGTEVTIIQVGAGNLVITGSTGVTVNSAGGVKTLDGSYKVASIVKRGTDSWYLFGNLV